MSFSREYSKFVAQSSGSGSAHQRRVTLRRIRRAATRAALQDAEAQAKADRRKEIVDAAVSWLSNYSWTYFITLTSRHELAPEAWEKAVQRFMRFVHEQCFEEFTSPDVRDMFGIRYLPAIERGGIYGRLHAHVLIAGGDAVSRARWTIWREWWNKHFGGCRIEKPESQGDVAAYCTKYMLKGEEFGFELRSTWDDERQRRKSGEAPLYEERKVGYEVLTSAELPRTAFRGEWPKHLQPQPIASGRPCHLCGLRGSCECGTVKQDQEYKAFHLNQKEQPTLQPITAPSAVPRCETVSAVNLASRTVLHGAEQGELFSVSSRKERLLRRRRKFESRCSTRFSVAVNAVCSVHSR